MSEKENDVDALLSSLTGATEDSKKPEVKAKSSSQFDSFGERAGGFKIDPRDSYLTGTDHLRKNNDALGVNPTDFDNQVEIAKEKKTRKNLFIALGVVTALLALGGLAWATIPQGKGIDYSSIPTDDTSAQRFLQLYPDAPIAPTETVMQITADENGLQITDGGYRLTFAGMDFENLNYSATAPSDFGPAATAQVEGDWNGTTVYLFKDMAHTKAFANAWDGQPVDVEGSPAAAVMLMELPTGVHAVLAIVNPDSSGYMIVLPQNLNYASAENLADFVRIEESGPVAISFENKCNPEYELSASEAMPALLFTENDLKLNKVSVQSQNYKLYAVKFSSGESLKFLTSGELTDVADEETYELLISLGVDKGFLERPAEEYETYIKESLAKLAETAEFKQLTNCVDELETPAE